MAHQSKILTIILCLFVFGINCNAITDFDPIRAIQIDSLIEEKNIDNSLTKLELLVLYQDALQEIPKDSLEVFKNLALLNAELNQPRDAQLYSEKYITNTLDFDILTNSAYDGIKGSEEYNTLNHKYLPNINTLDFVYFYAALIGFFLALAINFTKKGNRYAKLFISGFIAFHSLFILEFVMFTSRLILSYPHIYRISSAVALLFGPLLFFYFRSLSQKSKFQTKDVLHFIPTIILLIFLVPIYFEASPDKLKRMLLISDVNKNYDVFTFLVKIASLIFYAFCIWKFQFSKMNTHDSIFQKPSIKKWFKNLYRIHVAYILAYMFYGIFAYVIKSDISIVVYHFQIAAMTIMILYIAYMAFVQPSIFMVDIAGELNTVFTSKYEKSGLTPGLSNELKEQLIKLLIEEKIYKNSDINLEILSNKLNTTRHNTSQIINEHFKMNFFELINKFRIKEAIRLLESDTHGNLNIIDVAYEIGYNNKVTFNKAFKRETSVTPSEYIQTKGISKPRVKRK